MPQGYTRGTPDTKWWMQQLLNGKQFRRRYAMQDKWDVWRRYYRGLWHTDVYAVNLFFMLLRSIVPRVYFRNPSVSISPGLPGLENMVFARILERVDNKLITRMKLKKQMKREISDAFIFGTGFLKPGFGGLYTPTPALLSNPLGEDSDGNLVEYSDLTDPNMPWVKRVHPRDMIVPAGLGEYEEARWVSNRIIRPVEDVRADKRFKNTVGLQSKSSFEIGSNKFMKTESMIEMHEIRDRKTGEVFVLTDNARDHEAKALFQAPDDLQVNGNHNIRPLVFNEDDEVFWGIPDSNILEPLQNEMNETKTQIRAHRRSSIVKILAHRGSIEEPEALKMVSEDVSPVVWVKGRGSIDNAVKLIQGSTIPGELMLNAEVTMQNVRETVGFSRNDAGEFNSRSGDTTATEASIVRQASEIRIDERRDLVADQLVEIIEIIHEIIFNFWQRDQIVDVIGPGGVQVWVAFRGDLLKRGRYTVRIDPDSSIPQTRALREQKAIQLYSILKTNPLIDPLLLTQYLLHELHGVQFDDMMRGMPMSQGLQPGSIVSTQQFGTAVQDSAQQVASGSADFNARPLLEGPG